MQAGSLMLLPVENALENLGTLEYSREISVLLSLRVLFTYQSNFMACKKRFRLIHHKQILR